MVHNVAPWPCLREWTTFPTRRVAYWSHRYPLVYAIIVGPTSVIRWINFGLETRGKDTPTSLSFLASVLFSLSGALNVTLLLTTRPELLLLHKPQKTNHAADASASSGVSHSRPALGLPQRSLRSMIGKSKMPDRMKLGQLEEDSDVGWDVPLGTRSSVVSLPGSSVTDA